MHFKMPQQHYPMWCLREITSPQNSVSPQGIVLSYIELDTKSKPYHRRPFPHLLKFAQLNCQQLEIRYTISPPICPEVLDTVANDNEIQDFPSPPTGLDLLNPAANNYDMQEFPSALTCAYLLSPAANNHELQNFPYATQLTYPTQLPIIMKS